MGVLFTHTVGHGEVYLSATETGPKLRKITNCQTAKNAKNSNFGRPSWKTLERFLRLLVLFVVVIVDHEELVFFLVDSFSHVRRAFFCILVLLQQNQVVDLVVVEHRLDPTGYPMFCTWNSFKFVATCEWSSKAILSCSIICSSIHPMSDFMPSFNYGYISSMLGLTSSLQHFLSLAIHSLQISDPHFDKFSHASNIRLLEDKIQD